MRVQSCANALDTRSDSVCLARHFVIYPVKCSAGFKIERAKLKKLFEERRWEMAYVFRRCFSIAIYDFQTKVFSTVLWVRELWFFVFVFGLVGVCVCVCGGVVVGLVFLSARE